MTINDEFFDWMEDIQAEPFVGEGAWGESHGNPEAILAYWRYENHTVTGSDGKTIVSSTQVFCDSSYRDILPLGTKVTLPGDPRRYQVVAITSWPGSDSHLEVSLA